MDNDMSTPEKIPKFALEFAQLNLKKDVSYYLPILIYMYFCIYVGIYIGT